MMKLIIGFLALQINCFSEDKPDHNLEIADLEDVLERLFETEMDKMDKSKAFTFDSVSYQIIPLYSMKKRGTRHDTLFLRNPHRDLSSFKIPNTTKNIDYNKTLS